MTNTRRLSTIAILSAISFVLMYFDFPLLPAASFLKIEFSILPVLVGLVVMDLPAALGIHRICFDLEKGTDTPSFPTRISSWNYWLDRGYVGSQLCLRCSFVR